MFLCQNPRVRFCRILKISSRFEERFQEGKKEASCPFGCGTALKSVSLSMNGDCSWFMTIPHSAVIFVTACCSASVLILERLQWLTRKMNEWTVNLPGPWVVPEPCLCPKEASYSSCMTALSRSSRWVWRLRELKPRSCLSEGTEGRSFLQFANTSNSRSWRWRFGRRWGSLRDSARLGGGNVARNRTYVLFPAGLSAAVHDLWNLVGWIRLMWRVGSLIDWWWIWACCHLIPMRRLSKSYDVLCFVLS